MLMLMVVHGLCSLQLAIVGWQSIYVIYGWYHVATALVHPAALVSHLAKALKQLEVNKLHISQEGAVLNVFIFAFLVGFSSLFFQDQVPSEKIMS